MTRVAAVAAIRDWTVKPAANPGRAMRFHPAHRRSRLVSETTPRAVMASEAVALTQKPRPMGKENVVGSAGRAEDHPGGPPQASYVHASTQGRPAARSRNDGLVRRRGIPRRFNPAPNGTRTFAAIPFESARFPAASTDSIR